jgi:hypothetical protein
MSEPCDALTFGARPKRRLHPFDFTPRFTRINAQMMNPFDEEELQMSDLKRFWDAVTAMRAAQKLEWAALPSNYRVWKRARQQQAVSRLEEKVDELAAELLHTYGWTDDDAEDDAPAAEGQAGEESADPRARTLKYLRQKDAASQSPTKRRGRPDKP